jgi:VWFA-related protein
VLFADFVQLVTEQSAVATTPPPAPTGAPPAAPRPAAREGRRIILVIDRGELGIEAVRLAAQAASRLLQQLAPDDRVALFSLPSGPRVDFTDDRGAIEKALGKMGPAMDRRQWEMNLSLAEAVSLVEGRSRGFNSETGVDAVIERECEPFLRMVLDVPTTLQNCLQRVENEARLMVSDHERSVDDRMNALQALCEALGAIPGPKVMVLVSGGLGSDILGTGRSATHLMRKIATAAAAARVNLYTLYFSQRASDFAAETSAEPETFNEDRDLRLGGLQNLTGLAGGVMFDVVAGGDFAFDRVASETSAHYLLGLEADKDDRDGKPHAIEVKIVRSGLQVRARRQFVMQPASTPPTRRARETAPPAPPSPVRMTTHVLRGESDTQLKVLVAAEVEGFSDARLDLQIVDPTGRVVGTVAEQLANPDGGPVQWQDTLLLTRGPYVLKTAAVAAGGKRVTAERVLNAELLHGVGFDASDLMLFESLADGTLRVSAGDRIRTAVMPVYLELYLQPELPTERLGVTVEVETAEGMRRASLPLAVRTGEQAGTLYAEGRVDTWALPPGRYVARAVVTFGSTVARTVERSFEVLK